MNSFGQTNDTIYRAYLSVRNEEVNFSSLKKIENTVIEDYQGSYYFGASESESELRILYSNNKLFAFSEYHEWENNTWVVKNERENVKYEREKLYIDNIPYQLYICADDANLFLEKGSKGLASFYKEVENEKIYRYTQFNYRSPIKKPSGKYPETSFVKLTNDDLLNFSKQDLKLMRNEIYARRGYVFKQGGEMDLYFSKKTWYNSLEKTTSPSLNTIETYNINLIRKLEDK